MESQIYGYIARVFKCRILNLDQDKIPQNNDLNISNAVLRISGLLIYLENKNKNEFLKNYQKKNYDPQQDIWIYFHKFYST